MSLSTPLRLASRANALYSRYAQPTSMLTQTTGWYHQSATDKGSAVLTVKGSRNSILRNQQNSSAPPHQLNVLDKVYDSNYYGAIASIMEIRRKYIEDRLVFVEGEKMVSLLKALGVRDQDFELIKRVSDNLGKDPTLPFRRSKNGRFCFDFGTNSVRRLEFQPFALSAEEDFKRYDSGQTRTFDEVDNDLQLNTVFQALLIFKAMIFQGISTAQRPKLDYSSNKRICTLFNLRTITTPEMLGEPALEGVHSDGVDHTMTTYLGSKNMSPNSAVTFMHDMAEITGIPLDQTTPSLVKARFQHRHFLDTLLIVDHERKHSISPVYAVNDTQRATRDMLILFTRKPVTTGHISEKIDSLNAHQRLPMEIPLWVPQQRFSR
jgi:hypothetical protein